jgi:hypothetical protein
VSALVEGAYTGAPLLVKVESEKNILRHKTMIQPATICYRYDLKLISFIIDRLLSGTRRYKTRTEAKPEWRQAAANLNLNGD